MSQGWRQYLEAGMHAGEMTRAQAQRLVAELVREGQVAEERARAYADEIVRRSRKRAEDLSSIVRREVKSQLSALGLATKADLAALERRLTKAPGRTSTTKPRAKGAAGKKTRAKTPPAKSAPAKSAPAKSAPAKSAPAKSAPAKSARAKSARAKQGSAKQGASATSRSTSSLTN